MAKNKKTRTERTSRWSGIDLLAFLALAASAILLLIGPIFRRFLTAINGGFLMLILSLVAQYCMLAAIAIPGWYFVRNKRIGWRITYFIFLAIYVAGTILGVTLGV